MAARILSRVSSARAVACAADSLDVVVESHAREATAFDSGCSDGGPVERRTDNNHSTGMCKCMCARSMRKVSVKVTNALLKWNI